MSETYVPSGLTVQQWDDKYFVEYVNRNWFKKFMGTGANSMIQVREDLVKKPGDAITITLINKLTGLAKGQYDTLEGNEEDLPMRSQVIRINEYKHAVKWAKWEEQKTPIDLRQAHKDELMDWNMRHDRDKIIAAFASINGKKYSASYVGRGAAATEAEKDAWVTDNADRVLFGAAKSNTVAGDHSASLANVDATTDKLTPEAISLMKRMAKAANPKIKPFVPRGEIDVTDVYILFVPSLLMRDLKQNAAFTQSNREARDRGKENPLFTGANLVWDNIPIYEIEDIPVETGVGAAGIDVAPCFFCGAQALAQVWAKRPETVNDDFDYKSKEGLAIKQWYEIEKLRFGTGADDLDDPKDHGIVTGWFAAVAD
jgi:N4-gp56 family major capsid protein